ncbi:hypothetical protein N5P18_08345 [Janibacter terrae]|uniref:PKD domain-containing protein n=1 Tax=Janibacter terrae TaxID=103817 RepID=A0ABZ2FKK3_9MICO
MSAPTLLRRERLLGVLGVTLLLLVTSLATAPPSDAGICQNFGLNASCRIIFGGEKSNGDGGKGGGGKVIPPCNRGAPEHEAVPCENAVGGSWSNERQCYVLAADPQPDPSDPLWQRRGKLYTCFGLDDEGQVVPKDSFWSVREPRTDSPGNLQEDLERGVRTKFRAMYPGLAPNPVPMHSRFDGWRMAPVGLWVWMWPRAPFDSQWGPIEATDESTGYYINARVSHVVWEMGDSTTKSCGKSPAFMPYMRDRTPTCGHKYKKPGNYLVRVTTHWKIDFRDAAGPDSTTLSFPQSLWVRIGENQVVTK